MVLSSCCFRRCRGANRSSCPWQGVILIAVVKFPLLYVLGYLIISRPWYDPLAPLLGFLIPFAVIVLKAAGRMLLGLQGPDPGRKTIRAFLKR